MKYDGMSVYITSKPAKAATCGFMDEDQHLTTVERPINSDGARDSLNIESKY